MDYNTIEKQLFDWESLIAADPEMLQLGDITLKVPIGEHQPGAKFDLAVLLWEYSKLQLIRNDDDGGSEHWEYPLRISTGALTSHVSDPFGNPLEPPQKVGAEFNSLEE